MEMFNAAAAVLSAWDWAVSMRYEIALWLICIVSGLPVLIAEIHKGNRKVFWQCASVFTVVSTMGVFLLYAVIKPQL